MNRFGVFDHFVELAFKVLNFDLIQKKQPEMLCE